MTIAEISKERSAVLDKLVKLSVAAGPLSTITDKYFTNTSHIVASHGEVEVVYAVFLRRRSIAALEGAVRLIKALVPDAKIKRFFKEGEIVPAQEKLLEVRGPMSKLSEVETLMLQKIGFSCISARNAHAMCTSIPYASFMDMHARHASGAEMNMLASYGAAVGSDAARAEDKKVQGFTGSSQDLTAPLYGAKRGIGTMPHALVGYTNGDVVEATRLFSAELPNAPVVISLVDYQGREVTDALKCADWFFNDAKLQNKGKTFGVRLDTHGGRFAEGLFVRAPKCRQSSARLWP